MSVYTWIARAALAGIVFEAGKDTRKAFQLMQRYGVPEAQRWPFFWYSTLYNLPLPVLLPVNFTRLPGIAALPAE